MAAKKGGGDAAQAATALEGEVLAPVKDGKIVAFSVTEAALEKLRQNFGDLTKFDVTTPEGLAGGKTALKTLVTYRTDLEKKRKELKAPILERGRLLDAEADRITKELEAIETPLATHVNAEIDRLKKIEEEKERLETARKTAIEARLQRIKEAPLTMVGAKLEKLKVTRGNLAALVLEEFQEYQESAKLYQESALNSIDDMIKTAEATEAQNAAIVEHKRVEAIRRNMADIAIAPSHMIGKTAEQIRFVINTMKADPLEWAAELLDDAIVTRNSAITQLQNLLAGQEQMEAMRAQLEALKPGSTTMPAPQAEWCVHDDDPLTCEVCNGKGVWSDVVEVSPEDVAGAMESEFVEEAGADNFTDDTMIKMVGTSESVTATYASGEQKTFDPKSAIVSPVVDDTTGGPTVIGRNEVIFAVHKQYGISITKAAIACAAAFAEA